MSDWQPIKTAPTQYGEYFDVWVTMPGGNVRYRVTDCFKHSDGLIYDHDTDGEQQLVEFATHWMPIPKGPERGAMPSWCVVLPNVAPGPHARAFAFERLLDAANEMLGRAYADHLADDDPDDPTHTTERQFWRQFSVNIAAQMGELDKSPPA